jgi:hypothetical protein
MSVTSVREMFDEMSLNVTAFLEVCKRPAGVLYRAARAPSAVHG